jgi:hypothetical protein
MLSQLSQVVVALRSSGLLDKLPALIAWFAAHKDQIASVIQLLMTLFAPAAGHAAAAPCDAEELKSELVNCGCNPADVEEVLANV